MLPLGLNALLYCTAAVEKGNCAILRGCTRSGWDCGGGGGGGGGACTDVDSAAAWGGGGGGGGTAEAALLVVGATVCASELTVEFSPGPLLLVL